MVRVPFGKRTRGEKLAGFDPSAIHRVIMSAAVQRRLVLGRGRAAVGGALIESATGEELDRDFGNRIS